MPSEIIETILEDVPRCPWMLALQVAINIIKEGKNEGK